MTGGFTVFDVDPSVLRWAKAAHAKACDLAVDPDIQTANLRHQNTWFVGVDALPNTRDGAISGVPLKGPWEGHIPRTLAWHRAQLSIVYPGYPAQDLGESDANHRYRITRFAAHVDGLLPIGSDRRRYLCEPHAFILGLPLNHSDAAPLMVWPDSHRIMGHALRDAIGTTDPAHVDLTEAYQAARRVVFETCVPHPIIAQPGQSILLHRHLLHGVAPWETMANAPPEGRIIAYFRPQFSTLEWINNN